MYHVKNSKKRKERTKRKVKRILIALAILALLLALLWELNFSLRLMAEFSRYKAETGTHIQSLTETVNALNTENASLTDALESLQAENARLQDVIVDQYGQVQELKEQLTISELITVPAPQGQLSEAPPTIEKPTTSTQGSEINPLKPDHILTTTVIVSTLTTLYNGLRLLVPAIP